MRILFLNHNIIGRGTWWRCFHLARGLVCLGHDVTIIDRDPTAFKRLSPTYRGQTIEGVGFDRAVLVQAGIERADGFASVTNGDNTNIVAAQIAKYRFRVPKVLARVYDPIRAEVYREACDRRAAGVGGGAAPAQPRRLDRRHRRACR